MKNDSDAAKASTQDAADVFIARIKNSTLRQRILANHSEDYPLDKASKSFEAFLEGSHADEFLGKRSQS